MHEIPVGLIGYGFGGSVFHAPLIRRTPGLRLDCVVTSRREQVERMPGVRVLGSVAELLADAGVPLVVISSPSGTHPEIARAALLAGKDVVVDKPIAITADEAGALIDLADRKGRMLTVFHNRRWDGDFLTVKQCIAGNRLGTVYHYEAHYDRFRREVVRRWKEQPGIGSGILYDLGPHVIDQALQLFGMPSAVTADVFAQREGAQAVDCFHLLLHYGRMRAVLHATMLAPRAGPHFVIHGDGGSFFKYGMDPQERALMAGKLPGDTGWDSDIADQPGELYLADGSRLAVDILPGVWQSYYAALSECLHGGGPPPVDPRDAVDGLRVIEAALRSAEERRTIEPV